MSDTVIRVENLSKKYRLGEPVGYKTLRESLSQAATAPLRWLGKGRKNGTNGDTKDDLWALKDINFEVKRGEVVGIIGRNGAGKSTLLKILSRITEPTTGHIDIDGRVGSLLEVGTGFHPELTGRENIYLNGAILGMAKADISRKFDEIVAFSEIEKFLDTPVKRYSSGMYMRLAFAVAAHLEPEILIVDEVLAVGDAAFQKKCLGKMGDVARGGRTVLFVSHNMGAVRTLCERSIFLSQGEVIFDGDSSLGISLYLSAQTAGPGSADGEITWAEGSAPTGKQICLRQIRLVSSRGEIQTTFEADKQIHVEIAYDVIKNVRGARFNLHVMTTEGESAFSGTDQSVRPELETVGTYCSRCTIPGKLLNRRTYRIELSCDIPGIGVVIPRASYLQFTVAGEGNQTSIYPESWPGVVCPDLQWRITATELALSQ